jgi:hypothetical protein
MKKDYMNAFHNATNGGLEIFKKYVNLPVVVGKQEVVRETDQRYVIKHSETYNCLVMFIEKFDGTGWRKENNFNAIWFVKFKFDLTEDQTYEKVDYEMNLNLLQSLKDGSYSLEEEVSETKNEQVERFSNSSVEPIVQPVNYINPLEIKRESLIAKFLRENISDDNVSQTNVERPKIKGLD